MNLIQTIAKHVHDGLTEAETAVKLEVEHGVQVTEDWVKKIISADGFHAALTKVKAELGLGAPAQSAGGAAVPDAPGAGRASTDTASKE